MFNDTPELTDADGLPALGPLARGVGRLAVVKVIVLDVRLQQLLLAEALGTAVVRTLVQVVVLLDLERLRGHHARG